MNVRLIKELAREAIEVAVKAQKLFFERRRTSFPKVWRPMNLSNKISSQVFFDFFFFSEGKKMNESKILKNRIVK